MRLSILFVVLTLTSFHEIFANDQEEDDLPIAWDDDVRHPRRMEKEPEDYVEKTINIMDQLAAVIGGFEGAINLTSFLHDEVEELLGLSTPEVKERDREREQRLKTLLPLFDVMNSAESKTSKEEYTFDTGKDQEKVHTAKDMVFDALNSLVGYLKSNESRSRPINHRIFDDEL